MFCRYGLHGSTQPVPSAIDVLRDRGGTVQLLTARVDENSYTLKAGNMSEARNLSP